MNWQLHKENLLKGETVKFRPKGNSMKGRIESGQLITVSPDISNIKVGDVVFCKVKGNHYVHLVKSITNQNNKELYLIGNNKNGINGWISKNNIFGLIIDVSI